MSAAAALSPRTGGDKPAVSLSVLQDILYDIVATGGADVAADVPLQAVEIFLHEHARSEKSRAEFLAFFEAHGLPTHVLPTVVGLSAPPPLTPSGGTALSAVGIPAPGPSRPSQPPPLPIGVSQPPPPPLAVPESREPITGAFRIDGGQPRALWVLLVAIALLLGGLLGLGYELYRGMQSELAHARAQGAAQQRFIERLEDRTAGLQQDISRNGELIEHVDTRSELLLDSLLPAPLARPED